MERRVAAGIVAGIIITATLGVVWFLNSDLTYLEVRRTLDQAFRFSLGDVTDAHIYIEFVDDPTLILRYKYELYEDSKAHFDLSLDRGNYARLRTNYSDENRQPVKVKYFNLTLGKYPPAGIRLGNIYNSSIVMICNNNATLSYSVIDLSCDEQSIVHFGLDEDVTFEGEGMNVGIRCHTLYLIVRLPDEVNGQVIVTTPDRNIWTHDGWTYDSGYYRTDEMTEPLVRIGGDVQTLHAWLYP